MVIEIYSQWQIHILTLISYLNVRFRFASVVAPNNGSNAQPSPVHYDVNLASNATGATTAAPGSGILPPPSMNQGSAGTGGSLPNTQNATGVGGIPRPQMQSQNQQNLSSIPINNTQLPNTPVSSAGPNAPGPLNRISTSGSSLNATLPAGPQGQAQPSSVARNIRGSVPDSASNLESMVSAQSRCCLNGLFFM